MGLPTTVGLFFLTGFIKVSLVSGQYCNDGHGEVPSIYMCQAGSKTVTSNYVYLDTTGAQKYETVKCSCELEFDYTTALHVKYRTENEETCGVRFELHNENHDSWGCESDDDEGTTVQVQALSNITFFRTIGAERQHVRACMGVKPGYGSLTVRCFPWQAYSPPSENGTTTTSTTTVGTTTTGAAPTPTPTQPTTTTSTAESSSTSPLEATATGSTSTAAPTGTSGTAAPTITSDTAAPTGTTGTAAPTGTSDTAAPTGTSASTAQGGTATPAPTTPSPTPKVAAAVEETNTAAIVGGVVGGIIGLILLILLIVCLICLVGRRKEKKKKEILFGPRTVRYNSNASAGDVQITENALYDSENPSTAMNQLFIGGIPETPGSRDSELPRFEVPDGRPRYTEVGAANGTKPNAGTPRKGSTDSETAAFKLNNEYSEIDTGISNPGYDSNYKAPYTMPYDNKLGVGTGEKAESQISSPYDYIDNEKLQREENAAKAKGEYVRLISDPTSQSDADAGPSSRTGSESGPGSRLGSESGPGTMLGSESGQGSRLNSESGPGSRLGSESGPGSRLDSESGPGSRLGSESGPGSRIGSSSGYANDPSSPFYTTVQKDTAHFGYEQE